MEKQKKSKAVRSLGNWSFSRAAGCSRLRCCNNTSLFAELGSFNSFGSDGSVTTRSSHGGRNYRGDYSLRGFILQVNSPCTFCQLATFPSVRFWDLVTKTAKFTSQIHAIGNRMKFPKRSLAKEYFHSSENPAHNCRHVDEVFLLQELWICHTEDFDSLA